MQLLIYILLLIFPALGFAMAGGEILNQSENPDIRELWKYTVRIITETERTFLDGKYRVRDPQYCTASIVGERTLLTVHHCVEDIVSGGVAVFYDSSGRPIHSIPIVLYAGRGDGIKLTDVQVGVTSGQVDFKMWSKSQLGEPAVVQLEAKIPKDFEPMSIDFDEDTFSTRDIYKIGFGRNGIGRERPRKVGKFSYSKTRDGLIVGVTQNDHNGYLCSGDSGGGSIYFSNGKPVLIGSNSSGIVVNRDGSNRPNSNCNDSSTLVEFISLVKPHKEWIQSWIQRFEGKSPAQYPYW